MNRAIGDFIEQVDTRNSDSSITKVLGLSIDKALRTTKANLQDTSLHNYKVIRKGDFVTNLIQVSRDRRIPVARYNNPKPAVVSPAYIVFRVTKPKELNPVYLLMWMHREEFDREAFLSAIGGVRGSLDWEDFCSMKLPVLPLHQQNKIVEQYEAVVERIAINEKQNYELRKLVDLMLERLGSPAR